MNPKDNIDIKEITVNRLEVPFDLTKKEYFDLKIDYVSMIVKSKVELQKSFKLYKEHLSDVLRYRRKLNDAECRLVEVFDRIEKVSK